MEQINLRFGFLNIYLDDYAILNSNWFEKRVSMWYFNNVSVISYDSTNPGPIGF